MEGRLDSEAVGVRKAQQWLAKYEAPHIDAALDEALLDFIARRSREIPLG
jgi:trimethylamine--corrinoid protein Co-methyltransferase